MIKFKFSRPYGWNNLGERQVTLIKRRVLADLRAGLTALQQAIMETPVYTGRTLVNYRWSLGTAVTATRAPVKQPALPGKTAELPLGSEPRRGAQAALVEAEFAAVLAELGENPFQNIYLNNNTPYFTEVEYGTYKTSQGKSQRTPPGGMVRRGESELELRVMGLKKVSGGV